MAATFWSLEKLGKRWRKSVAELLDMAALGGLELSVYYRGGKSAVANTERYNHFHDDWGAVPADAAEFLSFEKDNVRRLIDKDGVEFYTCTSPPPGSKIPILRKTPVSVPLSAVVVMADEVARMEADHPELLATKGKSRQGEAKEERSDLHIIGAMLGLLLEKDSGAPYKSEAEVIRALIDWMPGTFGISKRNLEKRFSAAKQAIDSTE